MDGVKGLVKVVFREEDVWRWYAPAGLFASSPCVYWTPCDTEFTVTVCRLGKLTCPAWPRGRVWTGAKVSCWAWPCPWGNWSPCSDWTPWTYTESWIKHHLTPTREELMSCTLKIAHLECLPLNLACRGDSLGLDEEGSGVDQLHTLKSLTRCCIQVLTLSHLSNLGLVVPRQLQDGLWDSGDIRGRDLQNKQKNQHNTFRNTRESKTRGLGGLRLIQLINYRLQHSHRLRKYVQQLIKGSNKNHFNCTSALASGNK